MKKLGGKIFLKNRVCPATNLPKSQRNVTRFFTKAYLGNGTLEWERVEVVGVPGEVSWLGTTRWTLQQRHVLVEVHLKLIRNEYISN